MKIKILLFIVLSQFMIISCTDRVNKYKIYSAIEIVEGWSYRYNTGAIMEEYKDSITIDSLSFKKISTNKFYIIENKDTLFFKKEILNDSIKLISIDSSSTLTIKGFKIPDTKSNKNISLVSKDLIGFNFIINHDGDSLLNNNFRPRNILFVDSISAYVGFNRFGKGYLFPFSWKLSKKSNYFLVNFSDGVDNFELTCYDKEDDNIKVFVNSNFFEFERISLAHFSKNKDVNIQDKICGTYLSNTKTFKNNFNSIEDYELIDSVHISLEISENKFIRKINTYLDKSKYEKITTGNWKVNSSGEYLILFYNYFYRSNKSTPRHDVYRISLENDTPEIIISEQIEFFDTNDNRKHVWIETILNK